MVFLHIGPRILHLLCLLCQEVYWEIAILGNCNFTLKTYAFANEMQLGKGDPGEIVIPYGR